MEGGWGGLSLRLVFNSFFVLIWWCVGVFCVCACFVAFFFLILHSRDKKEKRRKKPKVEK